MFLVKTKLLENGKIGFEVLKRIVWHPKFNGVIKLLETPRNREDYKEEIKMVFVKTKVGPALIGHPTLRRII